MLALKYFPNNKLSQKMNCKTFCLQFSNIFKETNFEYNSMHACKVLTFAGNVWRNVFHVEKPRQVTELFQNHIPFLAIWLLSFPKQMDSRTPQERLVDKDDPGIDFNFFHIFICRKKRFCVLLALLSESEILVGLSQTNPEKPFPKHCLSYVAEKTQQSFFK